MLKRQFASKHGRLIALGCASVGLAHFTISIFFWLAYAFSGFFGRLGWDYILSRSASAYFLFTAFFVALALAWRGVRASVGVMFLAGFIAVACFAFDISHHRYQVRGWEIGGKYTYSYLTWWLYEESRDVQ